MKKYRTAIIVIFILCVLTVFGLSIYQRYQDRVEKIEKEIEIWDKKQELAYEISVSEKQRARYRDSLIDDFFTLKRIVETAAGDNGITIDTFTPSSRKRGDVFSEHGITLGIFGEYTGILNFIYELEQNPSIGIDNVEMKNKTGGNEEEELIVKVKLVGITKK